MSVPDPQLSYFGHPKLNCGYNSDDNDGDEVDGAGTNWPLAPVWTKATKTYELVIISAEMLEVFDGCADYVVPCVPDTITVREDDWEIVVEAA